MNNLILPKKKKPTKSLNLVGFVTICFPAGGERGTNTYYIILYQNIPKQVLTSTK
jgi:hypothetical protein